MTNSTQRESFLQALWRKFTARRQRARVRKAVSGARPSPPAAEPLERRIAPASLINPSTLVYTDLDGDTVTIALSKPLFDLPPATLNTRLDDVFKFSAGDAHSGTDTPQQLQLIDLTKAPVVDFKNAAAGISFVISATKIGGVGDDLTDVGAIKASGLALGKITIDGDLGQIDCGNPASKTALRSLEVQSFHGKGLTTQQPVTGTGTAADAEKAEKLESKITGALGRFAVAHEMRGYLHVVNGTQIVNGQTTVTAPGKINTVQIGGALMGLAATGIDSDNTGRIDTVGSIGKVAIGTTANDGIIGGGGANSGAITAAQGIKALSITGGIIGGTGLNSGRVAASGLIQTAIIGSDIIGGDGSGSGALHSGATLKNVTIGDDIVAGKGAGSGIASADGPIVRITVHGDVDGNVTDAGARSGGISSAKQLGKVSIDGAVKGGSGLLTGFVESLGDTRSVTVGTDLLGAAGTASGSIASAGRIGGIIVNGHLLGGAGDDSGSIRSGLDPGLNGTLSSVKVLQGIEGGAGHSSGSISAATFLGDAAIGISETGGAVLKGGSGNFSGSILSNGGIGRVTVLGAVAGGAGAHSGSVESFGAMKNVALRGSEMRGGDGDYSGAIVSHDFLSPTTDRAGDIGSVSISGAVIGGAGAHSGGVNVDGSLQRASIGSLSGSELLVGAGPIGAGNAGKISVSGSVTDSVVRVAASVDAFAAGTLLDSTFSARDEIGTLHVAGNVSGSQLLAGYDLRGAGVNGDAQIGTVTIEGNWTASDLVAGVEDVGGDGFGNEDDRLISAGNDPAVVARIASVVINGSAAGSEAVDDHYGFVAQQIAAFEQGGQTLALSKTGIDVKELDAIHQDLSLREVAQV